MKVRRLQIVQQKAQIQIDSQMAYLSIEMPKRIMSLETQRAKMNVKTQPAKVDLDMEDFKNKIGIKSMQTLNDQIAAKAFSHVTSTIKEIANDAAYIGTLPSSGNPIADLSRSKMLRVEEPKLYDGASLDGTIKMSGTPGDIQIDWTSNEVKISWDEFQSPSITVEPKASVNVEMVQKPSVEFTVVEQTIPAETGRILDAEA